eukprot:1147332-Pelagomonas_calceolata.AAC.3
MAEVTCIPFTKRTRKESMGIRRVTSSSPSLTSVTRIERSLLQRVYDACKSICVLDRMSMKVQSKLCGCMSVKTKLFKGTKSVRGCR